MKTSNRPEQYQRRILIAVSGLSPQILTETLYGLISQEPAYIPTEIHLVSTTGGIKRAKLDLLHPESGHFFSLCREYHLPDIQFNTNSLHVLHDQHGEPMDDIRSPEQNEAAADFITRLISDFSRDKDSSIHASIAGGRKTMGYYLGYALSLYGRAQDRLSHVLVSEGYESHPDFFYPTKQSKVIHDRQNHPMDTQLAEVSLAKIPFVSLRDYVPTQLIEGKAGFSETITIARKLQQPTELIIDKKNTKLLANGIVIDSLKPIDFAFYLWMIEETVMQNNRLEQPDEFDENKDYAKGLLNHYQHISGEMRDIDKTTKTLEDGMERNYFIERVSRVKKELVKQLTQKIAQRYCIAGEGKRNHMTYGIKLSAEQVKFAEIKD